MMEENQSKVGKLNDTLYSRTRYKNPLDKRTPVKEFESPDVGEKWQTLELDEILKHERVAPKINPLMKKFFVFALLFFTATVLIAGFIFMGGTNFISSKNVDVSVVGPTSISAGEMLELGVTIKNTNNSDLELVNFSVQYPPGSRDSEDTGQSLTFTKDKLGVVRAGDEVVRNVRLVLIGSTGEVKKIKFSVEYKVKGSNATFYKDKLYEITIGNAPLSLSIESPSTITSGDTFITMVTLTLNSIDVFKNVMLRAEYPYGYSVLSTAPEAIADNNIWTLGDFSPGTKKTVQIRGRLVGENQEERTFRFYVGVSDNGSLSPDFKSIIVSAQNTIAIARPSLGLSVSLNGESAPIYVAPAARDISASVRFQNNLPEKIINPRLELRFSGSALDQSSVRAQNNGFYDSGNNRIVWNLLNAAGVPELSPGEGGLVNFSFSSLPQTALAGVNRDISLVLSLSAIPAGGGSKTVTVSESRVVKISSQVNFSSKAFYSIGPFKNSGPIPPKVETETTYSVVWNVGNTMEDINDARVTARLGQGVKWLAAQSALSEDISYNTESNTVIWELSKLSSGSGFSSSGREVAFQVGLTPSLSQIGIAPVLVTGATFFGYDDAVGKTVTVTNAPLTTRLTSDPAFIQGDDIVVK